MSRHSPQQPRNKHGKPNLRRARSIGMSETAPALLVRLNESVGRLPAGFIYELPEREALVLIMRRQATAVGSIGTMADLTLTEDEYAEATAY